MRRFALPLAAVMACGPEEPSMQDTTSTSTDTSATTPTTDATTGPLPTTSGPPPGTSSSTDPSTTTPSTTAATTTGASSTTAAVDTSGSEGTTGETPPCCLAPDAPNVSVEATTPIGSRTFEWAVFSISGGECGGSIFLHLFEDPAPIEGEDLNPPRADFLRIGAGQYDGMWPNGFLGSGPAEIEAHFNGSVANILDAEITFDEFDDAGVHDLDCFSGDLPTQTDAHVAFTIHFQADGWDIQGQGVAPFCPTFNFICP